MTMSQMADLIIVFGAAALAGCLLGNVAGRLIVFIAEKIRDAIKKRKARKSTKTSGEVTTND